MQGRFARGQPKSVDQIRYADTNVRHIASGLCVHVDVSMHTANFQAVATCDPLRCG